MQVFKGMSNICSPRLICQRGVQVGHLSSASSYIQTYIFAILWCKMHMINDFLYQNPDKGCN